jgi:glycosyltransferase involved in cell wall biosynthesis
MALMSVAVPAYNAAQYIRQTLESVGAQTHRSTEVIVIDDGSRDETPAIVNEWASRDQRVRLRRQDNAEVGAARNAGIREAGGLTLRRSIPTTSGIRANWKCRSLVWSRTVRQPDWFIVGPT